MWQIGCVRPVLFALRLNMLQTWSVSTVLLGINQAPCRLRTSVSILILESGAQGVFCVSMCSMWPQFQVTWSQWHLSVITRRHISSSISVHDSTSISLISNLVDGFHVNSFSFKEYHKLKSPGFRSGLRGGQKLLQLWRSGQRLDMTRGPNTMSKKSSTMFASCSVAPSCINHMCLQRQAICCKLRQEVVPERMQILLRVYCFIKKTLAWLDLAWTWQPKQWLLLLWDFAGGSISQ